MISLAMLNLAGALQLQSILHLTQNLMGGGQFVEALCLRERDDDGALAADVLRRLRQMSRLNSVFHSGGPFALPSNDQGWIRVPPQLDLALQ